MRACLATAKGKARDGTVWPGGGVAAPPFSLFHILSSLSK